MSPWDVVLHLRTAWLQEPQRALMLTVCPACRDALLADLDRRFVPLIDQPARGLEGSHVMGVTFSEGPLATCALHALLHAEVAGG
jgi:hypothetical protein